MSQHSLSPSSGHLKTLLVSYLEELGKLLSGRWSNFIFTQGIYHECEEQSFRNLLLQFNGRTQSQRPRYTLGNQKICEVCGFLFPLQDHHVCDSKVQVGSILLHLFDNMQNYDFRMSESFQENFPDIYKQIGSCKDWIVFCHLMLTPLDLKSDTGGDLTTERSYPLYMCIIGSIFQS